VNNKIFSAEDSTKLVIDIPVCENKNEVIFDKDVSVVPYTKQYLLQNLYSPISKISLIEDDRINPNTGNVYTKEEKGLITTELSNVCG
jgi:hypothetical protein